FVFLHSPFTAVGLRSVVEATEGMLVRTPGAWPVWAISTHDLPRSVDRWCGGSAGRVRCALVMLLTLRGTPVLYYGDELGMADVPVPPEQRRDPGGRGPLDAGRCRVAARRSGATRAERALSTPVPAGTPAGRRCRCRPVPAVVSRPRRRNP